jgi:hypothetical protein
MRLRRTKNSRARRLSLWTLSMPLQILYMLPCQAHFLERSPKKWSGHLRTDVTKFTAKTNDISIALQKTGYQVDKYDRARYLDFKDGRSPSVLPSNKDEGNGIESCLWNA